MFFCEKKTFKKDRKLKKIESNDRRNNLLEFAVFKNVQRIIKILDSEEFIDNAAYHSGCITKYLLRYTPVKSKFQEDDYPEFSVHDYAFKMLITDIHEDLTVRKQAFLMTQLLQQYLDYLPAHIPNTYPVTKLQDRLKIHYGDSIVVQIQRGQGKSNLVFTSDVSIGHVATAGNLKSKLKTSEIKQEISTVADSCNDDKILHADIRISRRDIEKISISTDEYLTANEVSLALSMDRMPLSLTTFICWLLDYKSFKNATEPYNILNDKLQKVMGITECIFSVSRDVFTPFHLGLWSCCTTVPRYRFKATYRDITL
jgi:hypothetical protein